MGPSVHWKNSHYPKFFSLICTLFASGSHAMHSECAAVCTSLSTHLSWCKSAKKSLKPFLFEWTEGPMQNLWQLWAKTKRKENSLKFNTRRLCSQPQLAKSGTNKARPFKCPTPHWKKEIPFLWAHPHTTHRKWRYRESTCQYSNSENLFRGFAISILAHELTVLLKWSR